MPTLKYDKIGTEELEWVLILIIGGIQFEIVVEFGLDAWVHNAKNGKIDLTNLTYVEVQSFNMHLKLENTQEKHSV